MTPVTRSLAIASTVLALTAAPAAADDAAPPPAAAPPPEPPALRMSVEIDPADYAVYSGWGVFVGVRPAATAPWRFRIGGGEATLPRAATETSDNNQGWRQRLDPVVTLAAQRSFGGGRGGWFAGGIAGWSSLTFTAPGGGSIDVRNIFVGGDLGYRWYPSRRLGLVITPHVGVLVPVWKSSEPTVGAMTYDLLPVIPVPQLLIGYELDVL